MVLLLLLSGHRRLEETPSCLYYYYSYDHYCFLSIQQNPDNATLLPEKENSYRESGSNTSTIRKKLSERWLLSRVGRNQKRRTQRFGLTVFRTLFVFLPFFVQPHCCCLAELISFTTTPRPLPEALGRQPSLINEIVSGRALFQVGDKPRRRTIAHCGVIHRKKQ